MKVMGVCIFVTIIFCVRQPKSVNATGLLECFERALAYLGMDEPIKSLLGLAAMEQMLTWVTMV